MRVKKKPSSSAGRSKASDWNRESEASPEPFLSSQVEKEPSKDNLQEKKDRGQQNKENP